MIHKPYRYHDMDDDYAPIDYSCVSSVSEGRRREQLKNIPKAGAAVRHRAEPEGGAAIDRPAREAAPGRSSVAGKLPSMADGPAPAARIAYPRASQIPENPYDPPAEESAPAAAPGKARSAPQPMVAEDGSQFDPPAMAQLPEWYRVAQQNSLPREDGLRRPPRVQAAPRYDAQEEAPAQDVLGRPRRSRAARAQAPKTAAQMYEEAGYPAELLDAQRQADAERDVIAQRRRHGAQYAVRDDQQADYMRAVRGRTDAPAIPQNPYGTQNVGDRPAPPRPERWERGRGNEYAPARAAAFAPTPSVREEPEEAPPGSRASAIPRAAVPAARTPASARLGDVGSYASNPYARTIAPQGGYAGEPEEADYAEEETEKQSGYTVPWLGIAAFAVAFLAVGLWLLQILFVNRTGQALKSREEAAAIILESHPYEYRDMIEREAAKNNLNPAFVAAIIFNESTFRSGAESSVGARGLMQVMSDTADSINKDLAVANYSFDMMYDAETNLIFGCHYLGKLSQRFRGDPILVAAAYHAGPNQVQNWLNSSSLSTDGQSLILDNMADGPTKQYAARVKRDFAIYRRLYYENTEEGA